MAKGHKKKPHICKYMPDHNFVQVTVLGWMSEEMPKWLAPIDPFDRVCAEIRKEMGWK